MPSYSNRSMDRLTTCNSVLQRLMNRVIEFYDNTITCGHRPKDQQDAAVASGNSKVRWPDSKHNRSPSEAVDAGPYIPGRGVPWPKTPTDWTDKSQRNKYIKDLAQFYHFAGFVEGTARQMHIDNVRWGGDWDRDHDLADQKFDDLVHFELI